MLLNRLAGQDVGRVVGQEPDIVRRRPLQRHLQRPLVDGLHADRLGVIDLALAEFLAVLQRPLHEGVFRRRLGIEQTAERVDDVGRDDRLAVGPFGVGAQAETVNEAVLADVPGFRRARDDLAVRRLGHQALEEVALDMRLRNAARHVRVEALGLGAVAAMQDLQGRGGAGRHQYGGGDEEARQATRNARHGPLLPGCRCGRRV